MPDDGDNASVKVELDGSHLRVDARPARLVSQLRGGDGEPVVTAQAHGGGGVSEAVPAAARQVTMRVSEELSVEATRAADFVALADEASGRRLVVAFTGEVTVLPKGAGGDRFALSAHEALLVPAGGGDPRVVPLAELSDEEQGEITSAVEAASLAAPAAKVTPEPAKAAGETKPAEPKTEAPMADATTGDIVPGDTKRPAAAAPTKTGAAKAGAGAAGGGGAGGQGARRGKKGKKGRPQPPPGKKAAPLVPAAAAGGAAGAAAASAAKKGTTPPIKKATTAPAKKTTNGGPNKRGGANRGGGGGGGGRGGKQPAGGGGDRRFVLGAIAVAALVAIVLGVFVLTGDDDPGENIGANSTTTSSAPDETTTTAAAAATTTAPAAATTTARAAVTTTTSTTARPATTTTAKPPIAADYAIEPKTCVQNGNSVTYTAAVTNKASAAFDFTIRVVFKDASGAAVASSDAAVNKVGTGKTVDFTATGTSAKNLANSGASCTVERVDARQSGT